MNRTEIKKKANILIYKKYNSGLRFQGRSAGIPLGWDYAHSEYTYRLGYYVIWIETRLRKRLRLLTTESLISLTFSVTWLPRRRLRIDIGKHVWKHAFLREISSGTGMCISKQARADSQLRQLLDRVWQDAKTLLKFQTGLNKYYLLSQVWAIGSSEEEIAAVSYSANTEVSPECFVRVGGHCMPPRRIQKGVYCENLS